MAPVSDDIRYVKLVLLLVKGGTFVAKRVLLKNLDKSIDDYLKDNEDKLDFARKKKQITETQINILFPGTRTDLDCWDISLYSYILLNLFDDKLELDEKIAIKELRNKRNELAHSGSFILSEVQFTGTWTSLMTVLFQLARKLITAEREEINVIVQELSTIHDFIFATNELNSLKCSEEFVHNALPELLKSIDQQLKDLVRRLDNLEDSRERQHEITARMTVSASTQIVMETAQTKLLNATQRSVSRKQDQAYDQDQTDEQDQTDKQGHTGDDEVSMACDKVFSDIRDQGVDNVKVEEGSILVTFRCSTISALKNISKYLADKMYEERLTELENALSKYLGSPVKLNIYIVLETLYSALKQIEPTQSREPSRATQQPTPPPKLLSDKPWRQLSKSGKELEESVLKDIKILEPTEVPLLLLLGPVGAGKSSFINSCLSVSAGRKKALAKTGNAASSYSLKLKTYKDSRLLKNFRLVDSMGIESKDGQGFHPNDIFYLLQGHVKKTYQFDPKKPITPQSKLYRKKPKFEHETHCVVFVLDAQTIHGGIAKAYIDKIQLLQNKIKDADVPRVLILTHVDMLCDEVKEDASNIFRSLKLHKVMKTASEVFAIEMASIHPVINYEEDFELTTAKNIPILIALRQSMQYGCDRVEYVQNESDDEISENNDTD